MGRWLRRLGIGRPAALPEAGPLDPDQLERMLRRDALDAWFPRCLDGERRGKRCDFDVRGRPDGPQDTTLASHASLALATAARNLGRGPGRPLTLEDDPWT